MPLPKPKPKPKLWHSNPPWQTFPDTKFKNNLEYTGFNYCLRRKFYQSIDNGEVKYDLRMHKPMNKLTGNENYDTNHDHGTGFRVKFENISKFYDSVKTI